MLDRPPSKRWYRLGSAVELDAAGTHTFWIEGTRRTDGRCGFVRATTGCRYNRSRPEA